MKKLLLLLAVLSVFELKAQENISFPESFKLDSTLLSGMKLAEIPEEYQKEGIVNNPGVVGDERSMRMIAKGNSKGVRQVYYEIYFTDEKDPDDAGVVVSRFEWRSDLNHSLKHLRDQSNLAYLIKDNYLIKIWSDVLNGSEAQIAAMVKYYKDKLQAEVYTPRDRMVIFDVISEDTDSQNQ